MTPAELRVRAMEEIRELSWTPVGTSDQCRRSTEHRAAAVLLAGLADWNGPSLRRATIAPAGLLHPDARTILLDAAEIADEEAAVGGTRL